MAAFMSSRGISNYKLFFPADLEAPIVPFD
jgi:hypothetical protein